LESRIVFIDGYCVLCNRLANYILKNNRDKSISVASLQGKTAEKSLPKEKLNSVDSVLYWRNEMLYDKSSAALYVISDIGGWRSVLKILFVFPKFFRDWVYDKIAARRYEWFGKNNSCELPDESTKTRVLD
jgi:predicted DCC family thiol-disulfide oxidoreductase YuxK